MHRALRILLVAAVGACACEALPLQSEDTSVNGRPSKPKPDKPGKPTPADTTTPPDTTPPPPPPPADSGGAAWRGDLLFAEAFDDASLAGRGWYDVDQPRISTTEHAPGSSASFECRYPAGATECAGGVPGRRLFDGVEELYVSYWVKYGDGWIGSGRPYHPHELQFMTTEDDQWVGPAYTRLTLYVEQVGGRPRVALQDGVNVNPDCILRNDDGILGCSGYTISTFPFGEAKSVAACNGLVGPIEGRDCYSPGSGRWYSARWWAGPSVLDGGSGWHFVESYVRLNSVTDGHGDADGEIRHWVDGNATLTVQGVLLRTGRHPSMLLNQLLFAPYIGDGSPVDQTVWYDELTVARGKRP